MKLGDANPRSIPGRGDMPGRVPGDPQDAPDGPEPCAFVWGFSCLLIPNFGHICAEDDGKHDGPHLCTCGASL